MDDKSFAYSALITKAPVVSGSCSGADLVELCLKNNQFIKVSLLVWVHEYKENVNAQH